MASIDSGEACRWQIFSRLGISGVIRRTIQILALGLGLWVVLTGCGGGGSASDSSPSGHTRSWEMGFYATAPRFGSDVETLNIAIENIDLFSARSEIVMIHEELPWTDLLNGVSTDAIFQRDKDGLINYLRSKGLRIIFMADLTDGLSRGQEPPQLRALDRHITEPEVQRLYQNYVLGFVARFHPDYIGLTAETNLVRQEADPVVYNAMVQAANDTADALTAVGVAAPLLISVQVETAWGLLGDSAAGTYQGIEQDFIDFDFIDALGLSSYPYLVYAQPDDLPDNYYSRLLGGRSLPVMVCEGGWPSTSVPPINTSTALQAGYITRHAGLLDSINALAVVQTLFTDLDLSTVPEPYPAILPLFSTLGLMQLNGAEFEAKPALAAWDELFARTRR